MPPGRGIAHRRGDGGLLEHRPDLEGGADRGGPPSAIGARTAKPDFFSRDTASTISAGPTANRTIATGFRRSPGGTYTERARGAQVVGSVMVGPFGWDESGGHAGVSETRAGQTETIRRGRGGVSIAPAAELA